MPFRLEDLVHAKNKIYGTPLGPSQLLFATLLDAGREMTLDEVSERLEAAGRGTKADIRRSLSKARPGRPPFYQLGERYGIDPHHFESTMMLIALNIRTKTESQSSSPVQDSAPTGKPVEASHQPPKPRLSLAIADNLEEAPGTPAGLIIIAPYPEDKPLWVSVVDALDRSVRTFGDDRLANTELSGSLEELKELLLRSNRIVGVDPRTTLQNLGIWEQAAKIPSLEVVDLTPARKSRATGPNGARVAITIEHIAKSTLGLKNPFGKRTELDTYAAKNEFKKLILRLESNAKALTHLTDYILLHGCYVSVSGRTVERFPIMHWSIQTFGRFHQIVREALAKNLHLEGVHGKPPDWDNPWKDASPIWILASDGSVILPSHAPMAHDFLSRISIFDLTFFDPQTNRDVFLEEIHKIRAAPQPPAIAAVKKKERKLWLVRPDAP
jgi:hypothetical protein